MSFQQPNFLFLLALLPAIVLLYILRSQRVQARVTTLRFWRKLSSDLEGRPARRLPLRELLMWLQLLAVARSQTLPARYRAKSVTREFGRRVAQLSAMPCGPDLARQELTEAGVHLVCLPHLQRTHLDGAAMLLPDGTPVIGVTLRYDRIDNFWFCLCHELAHVADRSGLGDRTSHGESFTAALAQLWRRHLGVFAWAALVRDLSDGDSGVRRVRPATPPANEIDAGPGRAGRHRPAPVDP